ncbi:cation diffusion facilitator family transporter [Sinanaerobacter chloroacetimidivorans]|uniref:Cation transporter n=1 Tax=Sinanaerobacter chloroacetimidivorans TaxID=2818044 RepID=A0A8J8B1S2_9FIRM|nr:cation diffusion facilitator family transporter [Sinanaerobacter chloroacetimidivorans]MBR0598539.1 cation transporter [Sinanaerobacter chloroacetimidivorans]
MPEHNHDHNHAEAGHSHDISSLSGKKIFWVTLLNATITVAEIVGGIFSGSLALLSDAVHNLSDTAAIALSYFANRIAQKPKDAKRTYGYKRAEILSALINSIVLLAISIVLIFEAFKRFMSPESINGTLMIVVASIGLISNFVSVFLLEKDSRENLNIKSSYLHLISDTVSSIGVLVGGVAIKLWDIVWIDPLVTVLISLYILKETWQVIRTTVDILMQSSATLDYNGIKNDIEKIDRVKNIHHVHSWMINEKTIYFEAHIDMEDMPLSEAEKIYDTIEHFLKEHYGISHITLQAEVDKCSDKNIFKI